MVSTLSEPLTIHVFFTRNLPAPHNNTERYLQDLLKEYAISANHFFNYQFHNVSAQDEEPAKVSMKTRNWPAIMASTRCRSRKLKKTR